MEQLGLKTPRSFTATETKTQGVPKTASKLSRKRGGSAIERWINRFMFTSLAKPLSSGYLPSMANSFATPSKSVQKRGSVVSRRATKGASSKVTFSGVTVIAPVRRRNIWRRFGVALTESGPRQGLAFRRRACGAASGDVRWSVS